MPLDSPPTLRRIQDWPYALFSRGTLGAAFGLLPGRDVDATTFARLFEAVRRKVGMTGRLVVFAGEAGAVDSLVSGMRGDDHGSALARLLGIDAVSEVLGVALAQGRHVTRTGMLDTLRQLGRDRQDAVLLEAARLHAWSASLPAAHRLILDRLRRDGLLTADEEARLRRAIDPIAVRTDAIFVEAMKAVDVFVHGVPTLYATGIPIEDHEVLVIETDERWDEVLRRILDSDGAAADVSSLLLSNRAQPVIPTGLAGAYAGYVELFGGDPARVETRIAFRDYVADRLKFKESLGVLELSPALDSRFVADRQARKGQSRSVVGGGRRTDGSSLRTSTTVTVMEERPQPQRQSQRRRSNLVSIWIRADDLWNPGVDTGREAFRRAARAWGFDDKATELVLGEASDTRYIDFTTNTEMTLAKLRGYAERDEFARIRGSHIEAYYSFPRANLTRLTLARMAVSGGYRSIAEYLGDADRRARSASFADSGMVPGSEAAIQDATSLGMMIASGVRGETGQLVIGTVLDPTGFLENWLGVDTGSAVGNGLSDGFLQVTKAASNLARMGHMFFITKPVSFVYGYNGDLPSGWAESYDDGGRRNDRWIDDARRSYPATEKTMLGQGLRTVASTLPEAPVYLVAPAAPMVLVFWNVGKHARDPLDELATAILVDSIGLMVGPLASKITKARPMLEALRPGQFETFARTAAANSNGVRNMLAGRAIESSVDTASNLADKDVLSAVDAMANGTATDEQRKLVVGMLLAQATFATAASVMTARHDADEIRAWKLPPRERPRLVPNVPVFRTGGDRTRYAALVEVPGRKPTFSLIDPNAPEVSRAIADPKRIKDATTSEVDAALFASRMRRADPKVMKQQLQYGVDLIKAQIEIQQLVSDAASALAKRDETATTTATTKAIPAMADWVAADARLPLQRAVDNGPNRWAATGNRPSGARFQRGLSGNYGGGEGGMSEARNLLSGRPSDTTRTVSIINDTMTPGTTTQDVTSIYSDPLSVRGRTERLDFSRVRDPDREAEISALSMKDVEGLGFFPSATQPVRWATNYLALLKDAGVEPKPGSRGAKFVARLRETLDGVRWKENEFGRYMDNEAEVEAGLRALYVEYGSRYE